MLGQVASQMPLFHGNINISSGRILQILFWSLHPISRPKLRFWLLLRKRLVLGSVPSLGFHMDNDTVCTAMGLCLGSPFCNPHTCHHCGGGGVDKLCTHGLSCRKNESQHFHHAAINDLIHQAFYTTKTPSCLNPTGLYTSDRGLPVLIWHHSGVIRFSKVQQGNPLGPFLLQSHLQSWL